MLFFFIRDLLRKYLDTNDTIVVVDLIISLVFHNNWIKEVRIYLSLIDLIILKVQKFEGVYFLFHAFLFYVSEKN